MTGIRNAGILTLNGNGKRTEPWKVPKDGTMAAGLLQGACGLFHKQITVIMKKGVILPIAVICGFLPLWTSCNRPAQMTPDTSAADEAAVRQADLDWSKAAEMANWSEADGYFSFLLDDVVVLPPNEPMWSGKATVKEKLNPFFTMPGFSAKWEPTQVSVSGDLGYTLGQYDMLLADSTGVKSVVENGKYLVIWKRQANGKWKVAAESFSSNAPAEGQGSQ